MNDDDKSPDSFLKAMNERRKDPSKRAKMLPVDDAGRLMGIVFLAVGLMLFWMCTYVPISQASRHLPDVQLSKKGICVQPLLLAMGLIYTIFGESTARVLGRSTRPSVWGWILLAILIVGGFFYVDFVKGYLVSQGYVFQTSSFLGF